MATLPTETQARPAASFAANRDVATRALSVACVGFIGFLFVQILMFRYGRDQGIYATVADAMLRGGMPYRDAWDFKPPGIYVVYALTRAVFGSGQWAIRVVEVAGLASTVYAFTILAKRFFADYRIGLVGGALAVLVHAELEFWHTAQPESFGGMLTVWAIVLATFEPTASDPNAKRTRLLAWLGAGALYGIAFLMKPPLGGGALVSASLATYRTRARNGARPALEQWRELIAPFLIFAGGSVIVLALCGLWFVLRGAAGDLYETLFVFTPHYTKLGWDNAAVPGMFYLAVEEWFIDLSSANAVGMLAAFILPPLAARERELVLHLLLVVAVQLAGVTMQGKFFPYHYGASLLLAGFLAGLGAYKLWLLALRKGALGIAAYATLLVPVVLARSATRNTETDFFDRCAVRRRQLLSGPGSLHDELDARLYSVADVSYGADRSVAALLASRLAPDETVFIWGFEPMIYDMAERRPASRFLYDVPQRVAWYRDKARDELMHELASHPPQAVVVEHRDVFPAVTGDAIDSADTLASFPVFADYLRSRYALATRIEDFDVYFAKSK